MLKGVIAELNHLEFHINRTYCFEDHDEINPSFYLEVIDKNEGYDTESDSWSQYVLTGDLQPEDLRALSLQLFQAAAIADQMLEERNKNVKKTKRTRKK